MGMFYNMANPLEALFSILPGWFKRGFIMGQILLPSSEKIVFDTGCIQDLTNYKVNYVLDIFRFLIKGRHRGGNLYAKA